ncbi:MAG: N-acetyltransferase family protein [Parcubacteria group bacterium]
MLTIRRATPEDAEALAEVGRATFVETFGHLYPAEDLAHFLDQAHGLRRIEQILAHPRKASWIVEADGKVVGYALAGPCDLPHPDVRPEDGELKRLYLLKDYQGGGTGSRLLADALGWLEAQGCPRIWIGVWSENFGAQRLYARAGFKKVGEYEFPVGRVRDREFIMVKPV